MMALVMAKQMIESGCFLAAAIVCPTLYYTATPSKAVAAGVIFYVVAKFCAPTPEEKKAFDEFCRLSLPPVP